MTNESLLTVLVRKLIWQLVKVWIRVSFPTVQPISTKALAKRVAKGERLVLIDARKVEEYAVSHLPNALQVESTEAVEHIVLNKQDLIVVYCSIGYRSARLAQKLVAAEYSAVNLEGSLFQWANENRPLVCEGHPTNQVHPFSSFWGRLLNDSVVLRQQS